MTNIYVGNLDCSTHEDQLQTLFAAYGAVKTVTAVTDRDTGQPRGFAFVEMTNAAEARDAIRTLNGSVHGGRALMVNEARPKVYRGGEFRRHFVRRHRAGSGSGPAPSEGNPRHHGMVHVDARAPGFRAQIGRASRREST